MRVLFVEDSHLVAKIVKYLFEHASHAFDVTHCATLAEARQQLDSAAAFDFALVDLHLPDAPGGEVASLTLQHKIPTIVLTGSYDETKRQALLQQGVVDYIIKESRYAYEYAVKLIGRLQQNRSVTVLLAEDSATYRKHIRMQLEAYQYQVIEVADGEAALEQLRLYPDIRLLITDFEMPKMNGLDLVRAARNEFEGRELRIIGLSASEQESLSVKFIKNGANDYLRKPFNYEELHCRVLQNIEQAELIEQVKDAAYRDFLTGLHKRRHLMEQGSEALRKDTTNYCLAMMDLDHFKDINDHWGHNGGDHVLKTIGELLTSDFQRFITARVGGEEFCVLLKGLQLHQAQQLMQSFCQKVQGTEFIFDDEPIPVTLSIGLTSRYQGDSLSMLMRRADEALYFAKEQGRNRVSVL